MLALRPVIRAVANTSYKYKNQQKENAGSRCARAILPGGTMVIQQLESMMPNTYTAEDIQVLEGMEAVRRRPGMYIGGTDQRGLHQLIYEPVDNAVDEFMGGHCTEVLITIRADGVVEVKDDGRGIPAASPPR